MTCQADGSQLTFFVTDGSHQSLGNFSSTAFQPGYIVENLVGNYVDSFHRELNTVKQVLQPLYPLHVLVKFHLQSQRCLT